MQRKPANGNHGHDAERGQPETRTKLVEAMLRVAGEHGYRGASVPRVLECSGGSRAQFYRHFRGTEECYDEAYAIESERLCETLLETGRGGSSWRAGLEAALAALVDFTTERPEVARGMLIEVHHAGGAPIRKRQEVFERLSRAIDSARRETKSRHSPPPLTAMLIVHMIDAAMETELLRSTPHRFEVRELTTLAAAYYDLP